MKQLARTTPEAWVKDDVQPEAMALIVHQSELSQLIKEQQYSFHRNLDMICLKRQKRYATKASRLP